MEAYDRAIEMVQNMGECRLIGQLEGEANVGMEEDLSFFRWRDAQAEPLPVVERIVLLLWDDESDYGEPLR
jgi:hypothetical protein